MYKFIYFILLLLFLIYSESNADWKMVYKHYKNNEGLVQYDLNCADYLNCISVASPTGGTMFIKTIDGGNNWFVQFADTAKEIYDSYGNLIDVIMPVFKPVRCIDYVTPSFGVAGHTEGQITITRDGGASWESIQLSTTQDIDKIRFRDSLFGIVIAFSRIFRTTDGGNNWEEITSNIIHEGSIVFNSVSIINKKIFAGGYYSTDEGETWQKINALNNIGNQTCVYFIDNMEGWMTGRKQVKVNSVDYTQVILHTLDGGQTWITQLDTAMAGSLGMFGVYFSDKNNGIAWVSPKNIWRTIDGGEHWEADTYPGDDDIQVMSFPNNDTKKILLNVLMFGEIWMYEETTSVDETTFLDNNLILYPNPASDYIEINLERRAALGKCGTSEDIRIFDMLGEIVYSVEQTSPSVHKINISNLSPGTYFIKIGGRVEKFVKM